MIPGLTRIARDTKGATAIEYGLIVSLVVIAMLGALILLADGTIGLWTDVSDQVAQ